MTLPDTLFYLFAALTLGCAFLVVANPFSRNPVTSAMFLVLTIVSLAGLFVLLHAYFLAAVQILVYAGAVMVLFLFVIMLLDLKAEERRRFNVFALVLGCASVAGLLAILAKTIHDSDAGAGLQPALSGETRNLGLDLFTKGQFLLPFEVVSLLLLVAMVGVILLSKRELK
ncbi:MAG: NADH-quinone oxidoreductase subunit J [Verrucomicrobia bacterium]|nr:NADH-quinone oxidoreductase subunit J [Verrucomicrobiota bacterium]